MESTRRLGKDTQMNSTKDSCLNQAGEFLQVIFGHCTEGFVECRAFRDEKIHQRFFSIPSELEKAARFAGDLKTEVFFGAGLRGVAKGTAESVIALPILWVDGDDEARGNAE